MVLLDTPRDLYANRDFLRSGPFFWNFFTLDRIRNAVELHRSRGILVPLHVSDADEPRPEAVSDRRERVRPQNDKGIAFRSVSEDPAIPGWETGNGSVASEVPLPSDFFGNLLPGFTIQVSLTEASRREVVTEGSRLINETEVSEKRAFRISCPRRSRGSSLSSRTRWRSDTVRRLNPILELPSVRRGFKEAQDDVGDFRECHGSVASLWKSQDADFSFLPDIAIMSGLMDGCVHAESQVPPIEGRIRQLWEPIEVSEDTAEAGAGIGDAEGIAAEEGEVDQPVSSFGVSMSGFLDL
ncbi:unnamed protein product [Eruca vesicaria subsp. sativa]|uniref:Uncharacterized protein n=1 Tax=Eruca vesicaria subsp. sativa TaxID=29727 RepID=A0ABC8LBL1_ERUVS|nr:unnamed protein product [Eruca vesicaria subsp. sativa]